ncbi:M14 family metallopeptidase [Algibacter miyuki]|uniref:M14 family metallopeptidase n=1 Tax=Algibacter miyuki TaxID=1306933 RepID=A0ABV5GVJ5_9FLAO|nr:M14 family metallopeptidase [Algibacter miyuki]MDN3664983.1 M14 family metallopeptidase [Algibacter miyuki]
MMKPLFFVLSIFFLVACSTIKTVSFDNVVDTTTKPIDVQIKQTYQLEDSDVYASNQFDGARLNGFKKLNDSTAFVIISPENTPINNSAYYAFNTWSSKPKPFYFTFKYPKGYKHRYIPKLKIDGTWRIIDTENVFQEDSIVTVKLNLTKTPITVAAQVIESSKDVKSWYTTLIKDKENVVKYEVFGKSALGKDLPVLNMGTGNLKGKDVIVLLTRQHPPEVTGYYAFQKFLETVLNNSSLSKAFLSKYHVLAFPIMNPDGVDLGQWRHNANGVDTNRDWAVYNQPEIKQAVKYIQKVLNRNDSKIVLGIDFHSTWEDVFYTNKLREGTTYPNFISDWFKALEANIPNYKVNEAAGNSTKPVSKGWFLYGHNAVGITYEIGDHTPKETIALIGRVSAEQMMNILTNSNN